MSVLITPDEVAEINTAVVFLGDSNDSFSVEFELNRRREEYSLFVPVIVRPFTGVSLIVFQWAEFNNHPIIIANSYGYLTRHLLSHVIEGVGSINVFGSIPILQERTLENFVRTSWTRLIRHDDYKDSTSPVL